MRQKSLVTLEMCHAVVSRYAMNEELCVEGVAMLWIFIM